MVQLNTKISGCATKPADRYRRIVFPSLAGLNISERRRLGTLMPSDISELSGTPVIVLIPLHWQNDMRLPQRRHEPLVYGLRTAVPPHPLAVIAVMGHDHTLKEVM
jgi:hypothetical protein